jgi:hypothetical protein
MIYEEVFIMETLKQAAINAISQLPDTANIDDMYAVFQQLERKAKQIQDETEGISCYDLAKDLLGSGEGPEDISTNANAKKEIRTRRKPSPKIASKGKILGDIMTPVVDAEDWRA